MTSRYLLKLRALTAAAIAFAAIPMATPLYAQDEAPPATEEVAPAAEAEAGPVDDYLELVESYGAEYAPAFDFFALSMLWTCIGAAMVFIMHLGFATLESGLTQKKNTVNVLFKNVFVICMGLLSYAAIGFNTHYPGDFNGWFSIGGPISGGLGSDENSNWGYGGLALAMTAYGDFIFQAMFAATAATIVSGAVAERVKLPSFMVYAIILVSLGYPIAGSWHWGGGFLASLETPFKDFAGSTVVHGFGGASALAAVIILGPRAGKYLPTGIKPIVGHSMPLATIGALLLWFGWFGFNGASVLSADPKSLGLVFTTTALSAAAGGMTSIITSYVVLKKPDLSMVLNGFLAGLVSITAGADAVGPWAAVAMGSVGGVLVVFSVIFLDKIKVDDPVGAISVHGTVGIWGTLAVGLPFFNGGNAGISMGSQILGIALVYAFSFAFSFAAFYLVKLVMGVRVSAEEEAGGLDLGEHGQEAYILSNDT